MRGSKKHRQQSDAGSAGNKRPAPKPDASAASAPSKTSWRAKLPFFFTVSFIALLYACVPRFPLTGEGDDNWATVLVHAHEKGFQFGTGIATTYGPLGFLTIMWYAGSSMGLRLFFDAFIATAVATGLGLLGWRIKLPWRLVYFGVLVLLPAQLFNNGMDILFNLGVLSCGFLCFVETGPRLKYYVTALVGLAVICVLAKFTLLASAGATLGFVACDLMFRRKRMLAITAPAAFVAAFLLLWLLLGQRLGNLPGYVVNLLAISSGYNDAMAEPPPRAIANAGLVVAGLVLATVFIRCFATDKAADKSHRLRRWLFCLWLLSQLFVDWKHAFVRSGAGDAHVFLFLTIAPMIALLLETIPIASDRARLAARATMLATCLAALVACQIAFKDSVTERPEFVARRIPANLGVFLNPAAYIAKMSFTNQTARARMQFPKIQKTVGQATVDVFGWHQAVAIFNKLNYHPRPIFQNYQAYHPTLIGVNDRFYYEEGAPEFVLFTFDQIDNRFPPLADSRLLVTLLANYQPVEAEGGFLVLRRKPTVTPPRMALLKEGATKLGEPIDLRAFGETNLWLEIQTRPSLPGKLHEFFFRPVYPQLGLWVGAPLQKVVEFRAPKMMLATGFIASPVQLGTEDVVRLATAAPSRRAGAYSVEVNPEEKKYWRDAVRYKIYQIETPLGGNQP